MDYYVQGGDAAKAANIKAAFEKLGIDVLDFGFADKTVVYCSIGGTCVQSLPYSINLMHILYSHPGYRELELPVVHEFKDKDWIVSTRNTILTYRILETNIPNELGKLDYKVEIYSDGIYQKTCLISSDKMDEWGRLWSIADAKDGDVLVDEDTNTIGIFEKTYGICWHSKIYCAKSTYTKVYHRGGSHEIKFTKPATKEQRDLLFTRIREAGYEWDADKKEFRKTLKVGDWVVRKDGTTFYGGNYVEQVTSVTGDEIGLSSGPLVPNCVIRLWTIQDAEDGDVLVSGIDNPFIYDGDIEFTFVGAYVAISRDGEIRLDMFPSKAWTNIKGVKPATKEQRDLLFAKIRESGYQWDAEKKELKKIIEPNFKVGDSLQSGSHFTKILSINLEEGRYYCDNRIISFENQDSWHLFPSPHYDIANFHAGMPVLVRETSLNAWQYVLFSHCYVGGGGLTRFIAGLVGFTQCIPFNDDTKHLLGTTDMPSEEYINW